MADSNDPKSFSVVADHTNTYKYEGVSLLSSATNDDMRAIRNAEVREDDVILATYLKSGAHWMLEVLMLVENSGIPLTSQQHLERKGSLLLEFPVWQQEGAKGYDVIAKAPSPRLYRTHLPIQFLPEQIWEKKPKIVYVARNPRDCLVSYYNYLQPDPQPLSWNETFDFFLSDHMTFGSIWDHQYGFWKHRNDDNFLYVNFEDMKKDPSGNVRKVAAHLDYDLSDEQVAEVTRLSSLAEMKATYARIEEDLGQNGKYFTRTAGILPFLYKGKSGGWKDLFTVAQNEEFQQHQERKMKGFDKDFKMMIRT